MADVTLALEITGKDLSSNEVTNVIKALSGLNATASSANFTPVTEGLRRSGEEAGKAGDRFREFGHKAIEALREIGSQAAGVALGQLTAQLGTSIVEKFAEGAGAMEKFGIATLTTQQIVGGSVEDISRLLATMARFGISTDLSTGMLARFSRGLSGVELETGAGIGGTEKFNSTIARLGVSVRNADGSLRSTNEIVVDLADAFARLPISADRTTMAIDIFGRAMMSGGDATQGMFRFLGQTREQLDENFAAADRYRVTIQSGDVPAIMALAEAHRNLHEALFGLEISYGRAILIPLTKIAEGGVAVAQVLNERTIPALEALGTGIKNANLEGVANTATFAAASLIPIGLSVRAASFALAPFGGIVGATTGAFGALSIGLRAAITEIRLFGVGGAVANAIAGMIQLGTAARIAAGASGLLAVASSVALLGGLIYVAMQPVMDAVDILYKLRDAAKDIPRETMNPAQQAVVDMLNRLPNRPGEGTADAATTAETTHAAEAIRGQAAATDLLNGKLAPLLAQMERFKIVESQIQTIATAIGGALPIGIDQRDIDRLDIATRAEEQFIKQMNAASAIASVPGGALRTSIQNELAKLAPGDEARSQQLGEQLNLLDQIEARIRAEETETRNLARADHEIALAQRQDLDLRDATIRVEQERLGYLSQEADLQDKVNDLGVARTRIIDDQAVAAARVNEVQAQGHVDNLSREQQILQLQARLDPNARAFAAARLREIALRDLPQAQLAQLQAQGPVAAATQQQSLDQLRNTVRTSGLELEVNLLQQGHRDMDIKIRKLGEEATAQQYTRDITVNRFETEKRAYEDALYALQKYKNELPAPNDPDLMAHLGGGPPERPTQTIAVPATLPGAGRQGGVNISVVVDASGNVRSVNGAASTVDYGRAGAAGATAFARAFNDVLATRDVPPVREHLGGNVGGQP